MAVSTQAIFHPDCLVVYKNFGNGGNKTKNKNSLKNLTKGAKGQYNGWMSEATARQCKRMINCLLLSMQYGTKRKATFVTLTLPAKQSHDDNFIKRHMLQDGFIRPIKRQFDVKHHFWRAEPQMNGNIHFHLLFDNTIHWAHVRNRWNNTLDKHDYIQAYRANRKEFHKNGFQFDERVLKFKSKQKQYQKAVKVAQKNGAGIPSFEKWCEWKQVQAYNQGVKENWSNPNSTDVHLLQGRKRAASYITKELTKNKGKSQARSLEGRIWGCNDALRDLRYFEEMEMTETVDGSIIDANPDVITYIDSLAKNIPNGSVSLREFDGFVSALILSGGQARTLKKYSSTLYDDYVNHYRQQAKFLYS